MSAFDLSTIAPRLAVAHRARAAELAEEAERRAREQAARRRARRKLTEAEWLIGHRDLQLIRAFATGDRKYIARRQRKLDAARAQHAAALAEAQACGAAEAPKRARRRRRDERPRTTGQVNVAA